MMQSVPDADESPKLRKCSLEMINEFEMPPKRSTSTKNRNAITLEKWATIKLEECPVSIARIMVYIKPWDSNVYENFFVFLGTIS